MNINWSRITLCQGKITWAMGVQGKVMARGIASTWEEARQAIGKKPWRKIQEGR